ncbi:MAG TPA: hypothetical protein VMM35_12585 [Longimicrobiales bacterium]|nr:hypothetical protein [Longimicrobiales bacterium]
MTRRCSRWTALLPVIPLILASTAPLTAQDEAPPATHLYEAYYKVNYVDLAEWTRQFQAYSVPVLEALRDEGIIEGWGHWQHNVGSEYNVRFGVRTYDWASVGRFWDLYLERLLEATPADEVDALFRMVEAHEDEIWTIGPTRWAETDRPTSQMYASTFQVNFADEAEWDRIWNETILPILGEAIDAGFLNGVVLLGHHSGGAHNKKVLYLFEEWDHIDDMWSHFFARMEEDHPDAMSSVLSMVLAHDDVIWSAAPSANQ